MTRENDEAEPPNTTKDSKVSSGWSGTSVVLVAVFAVAVLAFVVGVVVTRF